MSAPSDVLDRRARARNARVAVAAWEYRQRLHAHGAWFRLRRILADAAEAYAIPRQEAERLVAEGLLPEPAGDGLEPRKLIVFVPAERIASLREARRIAVRIDPTLLAAPALVLVRFP